MIPFQKGVKFVTAVRHEKDGKVFYEEQRPSRATEDYTRFVQAAYPGDEKGASEATRTIQEKGFDEVQIYIFRDCFQNWKKEEKSRSAKQSRSLRDKVKRKDDKRCNPRLDKKACPLSARSTAIKPSATSTCQTSKPNGCFVQSRTEPNSRQARQRTVVEQRNSVA